MRGYVEAAERDGLDPAADDTLARLAGHWAGAVAGHRFCACPTPTDSPRANIADEADFARFIELGTRMSRRPLTDDEQAEYVPLWERAFPDLAPWRR